MGDYTVNIYDDGWSTIEPYTNMFERCPSVPPLFLRNTTYPNGC